MDTFYKWAYPESSASVLLLTFVGALFFANWFTAYFMRVAKDQRIEGGIDELKGLVDQQGSKIGSLVFSVAAIQDRLEALAKKSPESVAEDLSLIANSTASANIQIQELSTANTTLSEMLKRQGEITRQWYEGNDWNPNVFIPRKLNPSLFPATDPNPPVPSEQPSTIKKSADKN